MAAIPNRRLCERSICPIFVSTKAITRRVIKESETHMAYATDISTVPHGLRDRVTAILKAISEARAQRRIYNRTLAELNAMTQRDLDDLGISAAEIPFIAREAAYGRK